MDNIKYAIEGILFAAGEPVKATKLAVVLDTSVDEVNKKSGGQAVLGRQ